MRVLFLTHRLPYAPNRGDRIRAYHIVRMLRQHAEVDVLSLVHDEDERSKAEMLAGPGVTVATADVPRVRNLVRGALTLAGSTPLTHVLLDAPAMREQIDRAASRKPDVVLAYCSGMARFALDSPLSRLPLVVDLVDVDSKKWSNYARDASGVRRFVYAREARLLGRFEALAARRAATTLVVNERESAALRALAPDARITVVENGIDADGFRNRNPPAPSAGVVFAGVMNYRPNEEGAVWLAESVWPGVRNRRPDATLTLVGSEPTRAVRGLASEAAGVRVTGAVPDVRPYLWESAVSAAPLHTAMGLQNKVLEAIAAGLPVVTTPTVMDGLPRDIVGGAVRLAKDADAFAAALVELLDRSPQDRRSMASSADLASIGWNVRLKDLGAILRSAARE